MNPSESETNHRPTESGGSQIELNEQLGNTVRELYQLLENYAPVWYTEELHAKVQVALFLVGEVSDLCKGAQDQVVDRKRDFSHPPVYD